MSLCLECSCSCLNAAFLSLCPVSAEFELSSFCKFVGPTSYSHLKHLRLDGNNVTYSSMPAESVNCLRTASEIMFNENTK